jgi:hypothetical protein
VVVAGDTFAFETDFNSSISATTAAAVLRIELDRSRLFLRLDNADAEKTLFSKW